MGTDPPRSKPFVPGLTVPGLMAPAPNHFPCWTVRQFRAYPESREMRRLKQGPGTSGDVPLWLRRGLPRGFEPVLRCRMARIEGMPERKAGLLSRLAYRFSRRRFGKVAEPLMIFAHHPSLSKGNAIFELALQRARLLDAKLKGLASLKAATLIGCPF